MLIYYVLLMTFYLLYLLGCIKRPDVNQMLCDQSQFFTLGHNSTHAKFFRIQNWFRGSTGAIKKPVSLNVKMSMLFGIENLVWFSSFLIAILWLESMKINYSLYSSSSSKSILDFGGYGFPSLSVLCRSYQFHFIYAYPVAQALNKRQSLFFLTSLSFNLHRYNKKYSMLAYYFTFEYFYQKYI